jgi:HSP20 family protein
MDFSKKPGGMYSPLQQWVERFFADDDALLKRWKEGDISHPAVNVHENPTSWEVEVAAPGFGKEDFQISADQGLLTIRAERKSEQSSEDDDGKKYLRKEFSYSRFERCFTLPQGVDEHAVKATFENGILRLTLPRKSEAKQVKARQIPVSG